MIAWFMSNLGSIVVGLILLAIVLAILNSLRKDKKAGKLTCGGNCGACGGCSACSTTTGCSGCAPKK